MITFYPSSSLLIIRNDVRKIVKAYSGAIAKIMWLDAVENDTKPKLQTMRATKQFLENKIKELIKLMKNKIKNETHNVIIIFEI
jgi:transcriptional regulator GlxA family with amidase domain